MLEAIKTRVGEPIWRETQTDIVYREIRGGFSWPESRPPFICVLGWENKNNLLWVLYEREEVTMLDLARRLAALQGLYHIARWVADTEGSKKDFEGMLWTISRTEGLELHYREQPSLPADLFLCREVLAQQLRANALILPRGGILQQKIEQLNQADLTERGLLDRFPELLLLARLVHGFESIKKTAEERKPRDAWAKEFEDSGVRGGWMAA